MSDTLHQARQITLGDTYTPGREGSVAPRHLELLDMPLRGPTVIVGVRRYSRRPRISFSFACCAAVNPFLMRIMSRICARLISAS